MENIITINIKGRDYTPVESAEFVFPDQADIPENVKKIIENNKEYILSGFIGQVKKLTVNYSGESRNKTSEIINFFNGKSYFGGVVGVIEGDCTINLSELYDEQTLQDEEKKDTKLKLSIKLQIQSRFDSDKPYFLATMLLRNTIKLDDHMVPSNEDDLYDYMLLFWYKTKLQEAYIKGFYRTYRRFEKNDDRPKGALDIARHIKLNMGQDNGKIAYSYRENTVNNYLNHLIVLAYEHLKKKHPLLVESNFDNDNDMKRIIDSLKNEIGYSAEDSRRIVAMNNKPISHPYYTEYEELRLICLKIMRDEGISIWDADSDDSKSILFYIPDLWEVYLEDEIRRKISDSELRTQDNIKIFGIDGSFKKDTYPDYVFYDNEDPFMILDAKFKAGWESALSGALSELADYDKCIRDMNSVAANATGVIFPVKNGNEDLSDGVIRHKISRFNPTDIFYTFPVYIPNVEAETGYSEWKRTFDESIERSMDIIAEKVNEEKEYAAEMRKFRINIPQRKHERAE